MTYDEESWLLDVIDQMAREIHENNLMLSGICDAINVYLANHQKENENDFGRNVLANLISSSIDLTGFSRRGKTP
jgi:hypothetical protein